jgi:hypothetical protein
MSDTAISLVTATALIALAIVLAYVQHLTRARRPRPPFSYPESAKHDGCAFMCSEQRTLELGKRYAELICEGARWVDRRKEAVTVINGTTLRRFVSVDLTVPGDVDHKDEEGRVTHLLPVMLLEKSPAVFTRFDVRDETSESLPFPNREDNAAISAAVLHAAAAKVLGAPLDRGDPLWQDVVDVAFWDPKHARPKAEELLDRPKCGGGSDPRSLLAADPTFSWLLETMAESSLIAISVPAEDGLEVRRKIVKISFDQRIENMAEAGRPRRFPQFGWRPIRLLIASSFVGARSYHFEARVPQGLEIIRALATAADDDGNAFTARGPRDRRAEVHLYLPSAERLRSSLADVTMRTQREGFIAAAVVIGVVVTVTLAAFVASAGSVGERPTGAPSFLLVLPTIVAGLVLRESANQIASRLLVWARVLLLLVGLAPFAAAARLILGAQTIPAADLRECWIPLLVIAAGCTVALIATALLPRQAEEPDALGG